MIHVCLPCLTFVLTLLLHLLWVLLLPQVEESWAATQQVAHPRTSSTQVSPSPTGSRKAPTNSAGSIQHNGSSGAGAGFPSVLFGPPGTGKTVTLVEAALQLLRFGSEVEGRPARDAPRLLLVAPQVCWGAEIAVSAGAGLARFM